jgi:hypothetical protein
LDNPFTARCPLHAPTRLEDRDPPFTRTPKGPPRREMHAQKELSHRIKETSVGSQPIDSHSVRDQPSQKRVHPLHHINPHIDYSEAWGLHLADALVHPKT